MVRVNRKGWLLFSCPPAGSDEGWCGWGPGAVVDFAELCVRSHCTSPEEAPRCFYTINWQAKIIRIVAKVNGGIALASALFPVAELYEWLRASENLLSRLVFASNDCPTYR